MCRSFSFLCPDTDILNYQGFDKIVVNVLAWCFWGRISDVAWFGIDYYVNFSVWVNSAHFPRVEFFKLSFAFEKLYLRLSFHEWVTYSVFMNPISIGCTNSKAQGQQIIYFNLIFTVPDFFSTLIY